ncbi:hypothetical protein BD310DRAFT_914587 [Dichomitus squalens]|uniref:Uncharacterized protein n=1 Tax=Dichomitus squalens TaxID=114155 RepID=A0A4Q9QB84_9APHY|nr:hypothetical protein BD310DRAFT_914587 [Dichomitus squalens]
MRSFGTLPSTSLSHSTAVAALRWRPPGPVCPATRASAAQAPPSLLSAKPSRERNPADDLRLPQGHAPLAGLLAPTPSDRNPSGLRRRAAARQATYQRRARQDRSETRTPPTPNDAMACDARGCPAFLSH